MGNKGLRKFLVVSADVRWPVDIILAAFIAPHREVGIERRKRQNSVCFAQRNPMTAKEVLPHVKPMVFAEDYPAVIAVFPHTDLPWATALVRTEINCGQ
jgi:hypothetical protein